MTLAAHVAPGASAVHDARTPDDDATSKPTPAHALVGSTITPSSGVRGSGFTSPGSATASIVQLDPDACEHCSVVVPPWGRVEGAAPTRSRSRAGATALWLVTETIAAFSLPGRGRHR